MADCIYMAYVVQGEELDGSSTAAAVGHVGDLSFLSRVEAQDSSHARYEFAILWLSSHCHFWTVGDPLPGSIAADAAPLRIAYSSISAAMLPLFVAKDKKLFDKHGVDVEMTYIRGVAIEALIADEVQFVRASPPSVVALTLRGADLAVIANTINVPVFSLMTRADLRRPEDLEVKNSA